MFDTMRSAVCLAVSLQLLRPCYTSNLYLDAVPVNFTGFIVIRHLILSFQLVQSSGARPSFRLCNHCGYRTDVCACRHVGSMMRRGRARGFHKSGGNGLTSLTLKLVCVALLLKCHIVTRWASHMPIIQHTFKVLRGLELFLCIGKIF